MSPTRRMQDRWPARTFGEHTYQNGGPGSPGEPEGRLHGDLSRRTCVFAGSAATRKPLLSLRFLDLFLLRSAAA